MPKLWKFLSGPEENKPKVENYLFAQAAELLDLTPPEEESDADPAGEVPSEDEPDELKLAEALQYTDPISYARIQSEHIVRDARRQAEEIIAQAEEDAEKRAQEIHAQAREEGYQEGLQEGMARGTAQALDEGAQAREDQAHRLQAEVDRFLQKAQLALDRQLDENVEDLRDLALAVAEKIVCVSLKSSSEVIGRMIQSAVDKRRRREWVHIYIAECDAKHLTTMPLSLTAALAEMSDRVRIIPMADDETGTCIIECPDEIIDASASTQMQNIRNLLSSGASTGLITSYNFGEGGIPNRVPADDSSGI